MPIRSDYHLTRLGIKMAGNLRLSLESGGLASVITTPISSTLKNKESQR